MQKKKMIVLDLIWILCFFLRVVFLCLIFDGINNHTQGQKVLSITTYCILQTSNFLFWIFSKYHKCDRKQKIFYIFYQFLLTVFYIFIFLQVEHIENNLTLFLLSIPTIAKIICYFLQKK